METFFKDLTIPENITHVKLDIGLSYSAPQSQIWLSNEENLFVFGFEPNPDSVKCILNKDIVKRAPFHGTPISNEYINSKFFLIPVALSNVIEPSKMDFYCMKNDTGTSSLFEPTDPNLGSIKEKIEVPVFSLKHFFDLFPWDRFDYIDYIKIDAQGADLDIIKSAGNYLKEKVVFITAEPENAAYSGCKDNTCENMENYLNENNFLRINHPNTGDPTFINKKFLHLQDKIYIKQI